MPKAIQRISRFTVGDSLPPKDAVQAGTTPDGRQLWRESIPMARAVPKMDEVTGKREFAKNPLTAEALYPKNRPEFWTWHRLYYLDDQGNGNVSKVEYTPPTQAELAGIQREQRVKDVMAELAGKLIDKNVDLDALLSRIAETPVTTVESEEVERLTATPTSEIVIPEPKHLGAGWWKLSNGDKTRGKLEEAIEAERRIQEAKAVAAILPEQ